MNIGILALQGSYQAHYNKLKSFGLNCTLIRKESDFNSIEAIVLPGGESTTMCYLLKKHNLWHVMLEKINKIHVFATCAGLVLLKRLNLLDIDIIRNGYGRHICSNICPIKINLGSQSKDINVIFIRAPIIKKINDPKIEILSLYNSNPVCIKKNKFIAMTFHPELSSDDFIYKYFLNEMLKFRKQL